MKMMLYLLALILCSCNTGGEYLTVKGDLEKDEVSGLEYVNGKLWALEDSGNKDRLYRLAENGSTEEEVRFNDIKNNDWEDITSDAEGNIYIGDFGNNQNEREDLAIYKISHTALDSVTDGQATPDYIVNFSYPEQEKYPPKKSRYFFDAEAFIEHNGNFYIFTKNRSARYDGSFNVYEVSNKKGKHKAKLLATLVSCSSYRKCAIAGADISPDGKTIALISSDKLWLITDFTNGFKQENLKKVELGHFSQKEGITFKDANTLLIADERDGETGGKLYELKLSDLKAKN